MVSSWRYWTVNKYTNIYLCMISFLQELEETREANRQAYRDKLNALDKMKENAELEKERELDFIKEKIEKVRSCYCP